MKPSFLLPCSSSEQVDVSSFGLRLDTLRLRLEISQIPRRIRAHHSVVFWKQYSLLFLIQYVSKNCITIQLGINQSTETFIEKRRITLKQFKWGKNMFQIGEFKSKKLFQKLINKRLLSSLQNKFKNLLTSLILCIVTFSGISLISDRRCGRFGAGRRQRGQQTVE